MCNLSYAITQICNCMCHMQLNFSCKWQLQNPKFLVVFVLEKKCPTLPLWTPLITPIFILLWISIFIDFINNLSFFNSCDSILVVVDCLTTMVHFIFCTKIIISKITSKLFFNHVFRYHGLLKVIILNCEL
jgi:hypothetical protein